MTKRTIEWRKTENPVAYPEAVSFMEERVQGIIEERAPETIWLLEHPALYTLGTSARPEELLDANNLPVFQAGRGGRYTYHGPGQKIIYVMVDLRKGKRDIRAFVQSLEAWIIATLGRFNIKGRCYPERIGVWVERDQKREDKIAAIGIRIRRWVTFHGIAINVAPDLEHFKGIVPCGITNHGITSFEDLGVTASMDEVDIALKETFKDAFPNIGKIAS
jgi:lipoyl(octanoyl) transferase